MVGLLDLSDESIAQCFAFAGLFLKMLLLNHTLREAAINTLSNPGFPLSIRLQSGDPMNNYDRYRKNTRCRRVAEYLLGNVRSITFTLKGSMIPKCLIQGIIERARGRPHSCDFSDQRHTTEIAIDFLSRVPQYTNILTALSLGGLSYVDCKVFGLVLTNCPNLRELVICDVRFKNEFEQKFVDSFKNMPNLQSLDISCFDPVFMRNTQFCRNVFASCSKSLRCLRMCRTNFFKLFSMEETVMVAEAISLATGLEKLDLSSSDLRNRIEILTAGVIGKCRNLEELHLRTCVIEKDEARTLASAISSSPPLALKVLDISCNYMEEGGVDIGRVLCMLPSLRSLFFEDFRIEPHYPNVVLSVCASIDKFGTLEELDFSGHVISSVTPLVSVLASATSLRKLDLSRCYMSGEQVSQLADALKGAVRLVELDLRFNRIDQSVNALARSIEGMTSLRVLRLTRDTLTYQAREVVKTACAKRTGYPGTLAKRNLELGEVTLYGLLKLQLA